MRWGRGEEGMGCVETAEVVERVVEEDGTVCNMDHLRSIEVEVVVLCTTRNPPRQLNGNWE